MEDVMKNSMVEFDQNTESRLPVANTALMVQENRSSMRQLERSPLGTAVIKDGERRKQHWNDLLGLKNRNYNNSSSELKSAPRCFAENGSKQPVKLDNHHHGPLNDCSKIEVESSSLIEHQQQTIIIVVATTALTEAPINTATRRQMINNPPSRTHFLPLSRMLVMVVAAGLILLGSTSSMAVASAKEDPPSCVPEFDRCVLNRDCCPGLSCVAGEWQYTTDSTCLSPRSEQWEQLHLSKDQQLEILQTFYSQVVGGATGDDDDDDDDDRTTTTKTVEELDHILKKYRGQFPKLVRNLERKYETVVLEIPQQRQEDVKGDGDGGSGSTTKSEEL